MYQILPKKVWIAKSGLKSEIWRQHTSFLTAFVFDGQLWPEEFIALIRYSRLEKADLT